MAFYNDLQASAISILGDYGQTITFTRSTKGAFVPGTGVTKTDTTYTSSLVVDEYTTLEKSGTAVESGDLKAISYSTTAPAIDDTAPINGDKYRVMAVSPISQGTVIAYVIQLRR